MFYDNAAAFTSLDLYLGGSNIIDVLVLALATLRQENILGVVTRSEQGSLVVDRHQTLAFPAHPIDRLVDTTGAGDLFAAGFLAGLARSADHAICARLGALAAAEVIQHVGARPQHSLIDLATQNGLT